MEGYLASVFRTLNSSAQQPMQRHIPLLNSVSTNISGYLSAIGQTRKKKNLMTWYKTIPELTGITNKVARDVIYKYHFEPINPNESGRNKVLFANKFSKMVELRKMMMSQIVDTLVTGEAFGWVGNIDKKTLREEVSKIVKKEYFLSNAEKKNVSERVMSEFKVVEELTNFEGIDEDVLKPRKYRYVASSTMEIIHDEYDIKEYVQTMGVRQEKFTPKEIIRFTQMDADGRVAGFTPVESIVVQLELLRQMWQNMLSLHRNGGHPDKIFVLENERVDTPSYKRIEEQLMKYKLVENKHGNMLFTGSVKVEDLNQLDSMQFKDEGLYITGVIAMQWQVPKSSIPYIVGGTNTKDDTGGNSEKSYWRTVEVMQQDFADTMNTQLWIPYFGVKIVFDNTFLNQDVQFHTAEQLKLNNIRMTDEILGKSKKKICETKRLRMLGLTIEDVEEDDSLDEEVVAYGMNEQPSKADLESDAKKGLSARKKQEQEQTSNAQGKKPSGVGN